MEYNGAVFTQSPKMTYLIIRRVLICLGVYSLFSHVLISPISPPELYAKFSYISSFQSVILSVLFFNQSLNSLSKGYSLRKGKPVSVVIVLVSVVTGFILISIEKSGVSQEWVYLLRYTLFGVLGIIVGYFEWKCFQELESMLQKSAASARKIITALNEHYAKDKAYPVNLESLVPEFLDEVPALEIRQTNDTRLQVPAGKKHLCYDKLNQDLPDSQNGYLLFAVVGSYKYVYMPGLTKTGFIEIRNLRYDESMITHDYIYEVRENRTTEFTAANIVS